MTARLAMVALASAAFAFGASGCEVNEFCVDCRASDDAASIDAARVGFDAAVPADAGPTEDACIPAGAEVCNGVDDDCDGVVDDNPAQVGDACGTDEGECVAGTYECTDGELVCGGGAVPATPESCNGLDDDCDGTVDDGDPGGGIPCGDDTGECQRGTTMCSGGEIVCAGEIGPAPELCDIKDNDCDGMIDEDNPEGGAACGDAMGDCMPGTVQCIGGSLQCVGGTGPTFEVCDGADNDCDGAIDEDFDFDNDPTHCGDCTTACSVANGQAGCALGECTVAFCFTGFWDIDGLVGNGCEYACDFAGAEVCNGADDDCDDSVDEGLSPPGICNGIGECSGTVATCEGGDGWKCNYGPTVSTDAAGDIVPEADCDGLDNDCDGVPDDAFPTLGDSCSKGVGECRTTGTIVCNSADDGVECNAATPPAGSTETCNGLDDDCDGSVDEGDLNDWVQISDGSFGTKWIFAFEASRPDATDVEPGLADVRPCSRPGALPWTMVAQPDAEAACAAVGARLCSEAEWERACRTAAVTPFPQEVGGDGVVAFEAEQYDANVPQGGHSWIPDSSPGYSGSGALFASPDIGTNNNTGYVANSPRLDYQVAFTHTGTHYVWVRGWGDSGSDDSCHAGLDGVGPTSGDRISPFSPAWGWTNDTMDGVPATINVTTTGVHTFNIWMREDGFRIDKILLTTNPAYVPTGDGPSSDCNWSYSTACNSYQQNTCNGNDYDCDAAPGDQDCLLATGEMAACFADWGVGNEVFDMSGNVKEWTLERSPGVNPLRGGSYNNNANGISCGFDFSVADDSFVFPNVGFRCCRDTAPP